MCFTIDRIILTSLSQEERFNPHNGHTDVIVVMANGAQYVASFFSFNSIDHIASDLRERGDNLNGTYIWASNMILIDACTEANIGRVVREMIEEGDFQRAFSEV